jgi:hypothetical protein
METTTVSVQGAQTAAQLIPAYTLVTQQLALVNTAIANSAVISASTFTVTDPVAGISEFNIQPGGLSIDESASVFNEIVTILTARQTAVAAEIAALS